MMPHPATIAPYHSENSDSSPPNNSQDGNRKITFKHVLRNWCCIGSNSDHGFTSSTSSTTLFQMWFAQNVYPLVTLKRIFCFTLSQISFFLAYGFFCQTKLYKSYIYGGDEDHDHNNHSFFQQARPLVFLAAAFGVHTMCLIFFFFFSFCSVALEKHRCHYLLKSLGEYLVKILVVFLIMEIGNDHPTGPLIHVARAPTPTSFISFNDTNNMEYYYSKVAGLATWCLLTVDALGIIGLLSHAHHYSLFEATVTLTLHLGLAKDQNYCRIPAAVFVFVIVVIKNFLWRHIDHPQAPTNSECCPVAWVAPEVV